MRKILCAVMLSLCLGTGLQAADLTAAQIQAIYAAAKNNKNEVTLKIDGKDVEFTINADAVGNIFAEPKASTDKSSLGILGIRIVVTTDGNGSKTPKSVTAVSTNKAISKFDIKMNDDGTIAGLLQPTAQQPVDAPKLTGGIGQNTDGGTTGGTTTTTLFDAVSFVVDAQTPAGTSAGDGAPAGSFYQQYSNMLP